MSSVDGEVAQAKLFGPFFSNVEECLSIMKWTDTVASGSAVLYALEDAPSWKPGDLDLYMRRARTTPETHVLWSDYLRSEGYTLIPKAGGMAYTQPAVQYMNISKRKIIQLIDCRRVCEYILSTFWSTHLMNFATHESIYSLFPRLTLGKKMILLGWLEERQLIAYEKYVDRGYRWLSWNEAAQEDEISSQRSIGDILTRRIPFKANECQIPLFVQRSFHITPEGVRW